MESTGKLLLALGVALLAAGGLLLAAARAHLPLGRLPGDLHWRGRHAEVWFPLGTSILLSVLLTLVLAVLSRIRR